MNIKMEQKQISCGPVYDRVPPLSAKYQWFVAQSPEDDQEGTGDQFFYNIQDPLSCYRCRIPELLGKRIRGSFHGWLILSNDNMWSLWNPVTSKIMRLPPLILKDGDSTSIKECCLSLPPDDPKSILMLVRTDKPTFVFCLLDRGRKRLKWTEMSYAKQLKRITGDGCFVHSLSCCNGKLYALSTDNTFYYFVIEIGIMVKDGEVVIKLMLFAGRPDPPFHRGSKRKYFLTGSNSELFCIIIGLNFDVETDTTFSTMSLNKVDMTSIDWAKLEGLKRLDLTAKSPEEMEEEFNEMELSSEIWEKIEDLKDGNFFVDLARDNLVAYSPAVASEFGGKIHIRSKTGKIIYSYNLSDGSILLSSMFPSPVLPTSRVSVWECRLAVDYAKATQEVEDKDREIVVRQMIMEFCIGLEYLNFRATCKRCHLAAPVLQWRGEAALKRLENYSLLSPWLMVVDKKRGVVTFEDPLFGYKYFMKKLPDSIGDGEICYSAYGWLLFYTEYGLEFCNPFTNEVHDLPVPDIFFYSLCFSAPPFSPDCMVVGFNTEDLYALGDDGELHVFKNLAQEDFSWKKDVVEAPRSCCRSSNEFFLTKCGHQHLLLVIVAHFGESIEVFMLNHLTSKWEKINSLAKLVIYISDSACFCSVAKMPEMENKIFFARLYNKNGKVAFYSLETGMYHTLNAKNIEESFEDFVGTKHYPFNPHVWIEPRWF
ncbi:hypothetical protein CTI12_AA345250 [Artemisia annua]|uniref:KIB1-4 beta-propeller domain-containing protein n=1 Tax=Artemisia annua TaxID=35608 RepID=A0A2U1MSW8_ARTAN|nr:hypothetical protein CTI12_AA345250 [Artemisia annua]